MLAVQRQTGIPRKMFFVQGSAGTGKTYMLNRLRDITDLEGMLAEINGTMGIAASLYEGGQILQSLLRLGVADKDSTSTTIATWFI